MPSASSSKVEAGSRSLGEVSLVLLPTQGRWGSLSGQGRALQREWCSMAWEVSSRGSSAPVTGIGCASLSRTVTGCVRYLSTERFQTAPRPLQSVVKQPAVCAVLAAPPPHPHVRTQAVGWEQLAAPPKLAAQGMAWGAAGRCPGKEGAGERAGQGCRRSPQESQG